MALNMNQLAAITDPDDDDLLHIRNTSGIDVKIKWSDVLEKTIPVGFMYIQFPGETAPSTLFGFGTWTNQSANFAGNFFRAEGGDALAYDGGEQAHSMGTHNHKWYDYISNANTGAIYRDNVSYGQSYNSGGSAQNIGSSADATFPDQWTSNIATAESGETRPVNRTVRIWERTA